MENGQFEILFLIPTADPLIGAMVAEECSSITPQETDSVRLKSLLLPLAILCSGTFAKNTAQSHEGVLFGFGIGIGASKLTANPTGDGIRQEFTGGGSSLDLRLGGAIAENFSLHATILMDQINGTDLASPHDPATSEAYQRVGFSFMGLGFTNYIMPSNFFVSVSGGIADFDRQFVGKEVVNSDKAGLGLQLKVGKEWWVSSNWALGLAADFEWATVKPEYPVEGMVSAPERDFYRNIGLQFSASYQ